MKEVAREKTMTTKEVAEVLGYTPDMINRKVRELYPNIVKNGVQTRLNEVQVTEIKQALLHTNKVIPPKNKFLATTDYEKYEVIALAAQYACELLEKVKAEKEQLQIELDQAKEWFTVKRVLIETGIEYAWAPLRKYSKENGYPIEKVFDKNYGEVNAYHIDVWNKVYGVEL